MNNFSLLALKIHPETEKTLSKVLEPGWFFFNTLFKENNNVITKNSNYPLYESFWKENITVQAVVGKNGSGKSSLFELIFRIIHNMSFKLGLLYPLDKNDTPTIVKGIHAELYFLIEKTLYGLKCSDEKIFLKSITDNLKEEINTQQIDWENECSPEDKDLLKTFFYTIVVNYSIQAYISNDYMENPGNPYSWIDYLFHKNDGYTTPIVLNPFRNRGKFDLNNEYDLTTQRLASLLLLFKNKDQQFIKGFDFKGIDLTYNTGKITKRFRQEEIEGNKSDAALLSSYNSNSIFNKILEEYGYTDIESADVAQEDTNPPFETTQFPILNAPRTIAYHYLVVKTISISQTYPGFDDYKIDINVEKDMTKDTLNTPFGTYNELITNLVSKIADDNSHVTLKIKQVLNFIHYLDNGGTDETNIPYDYMLQNNLFKNNQSLSELDRLIAALPPSFFTMAIILDKIENKNGQETKEEVKFSRMSSGERQYLYAMSTFFYHIKNISSVPEQEENRFHYNNINLIIEEIEICFHPELQKQFLNKMLDDIARLNLNENTNINIILATHSPFILSDIPSCNIMYLDEGKQINDKFKEPFGANIHNIINQSFFLDNSVGDFAIKEIQHIVDHINKYKKDKTSPTETKYKELSKIISTIGEPLLKVKIQSMLDEAYCSEDKKEDMDEEIKLLEIRLNLLKERKEGHQ